MSGHELETEGEDGDVLVRVDRKVRGVPGVGEVDASGTTSALSHTKKSVY